MRIGPSSVVIRVARTRVTLARYVRHLRWQLLFDGEQSARDRVNVVPFTLLRTLATEELVQQLARSGFGVTSARGALAEALRDHLGDGDGAARKLREVRRVTGLTQAEYDAMVKATTLADALEEHFERAASADPRELLLRAYRDPELPIELGWVPVRVLPQPLRRDGSALRPGARTRGLPYDGRPLMLECIDERPTAEPGAPPDLDRWLALEERLGRVAYTFDSDRYAWAIERVDDLLRADRAELVGAP